MKSVPRWGETICASASVLPSPIAVIRLSGSETLPALQRIFLFRAPPISHHIFQKVLELPSIRDKVMMWFAPGPKTMTGEDYAEIMVHGSHQVVKETLGLLYEQGLRLAEPGEFSYRGYINGKMPLMQALSVASVIASENRSDLEAVKHLKNNAVDTHLARTKEHALNLYNGLQVLLDYSEQGYALDELEAVVHQESQALASELACVEKYLLPLITHTQKQSLVIVGNSNVGKSTLFNALVGYDRAISSPMPGTTRDYISSEFITQSGRKMELVDTAGLRETSDAVEIQGIEGTLSILKHATAVVWVISLEKFNPKSLYWVLEYIRVGVPVWVVGSKLDVADDSEIVMFESWISRLATGRERMSWITLNLLDKSDSRLEKAIDDLCSHVSRQVSIQCLLPGDVRSVVQEVIQRGQQCLERFKNQEYDVGQVYLERMIPSLSILTGEISKDEIYQRLFSSFCLGK